MRDERSRRQWMAQWTAQWMAQWVGRLALAALFVLVPACRCERAAPAGPLASTAPSEAVPAPRGVLGELYVPRPEVVWSRALPALALAVGFRPPSFAAVAAELFGIPAAYAPAVKLDRPVTGVIVDAAPPRLVLALPLASGRELIAALTTGNAATHRAAEAEDRSVVVLEPQRPERAGKLVIGVTGNALLVGARGDDLGRYGAYASRGLGRRAMPTGPIELIIPREAIDTVLVPRLGERWRVERERLARLERQSRASHGGREPDFADPAAVLGVLDAAVTALQGWAASAEQLRITIDVGPERAEVRGVLAPMAKGAARDLVDSLTVGDTRALLALPAGAGAAVCLRSSEAGRSRQAERLRATLTQVLGARLPPPDRVLLERAFTELARAGGDRLALGLLGDARGRALVMQLDAPDASAFDLAMRALVRTAEVKAMTAPIAAFLGEPAVALDRPLLAGLEPAPVRARFVFTPSPRGASPSRERAGVELWWHAAQGRGHAALGVDGGTALAASVAADGAAEASLAGRPEFVAATNRAGTEVSVAALLDPAWALGGAAGPGAREPVSFTIGRTEGRLALRLEADSALVAAMVSRAAGTAPPP